MALRQVSLDDKYEGRDGKVYHRNLLWCAQR